MVLIFEIDGGVKILIDLLFLRIEMRMFCRLNHYRLMTRQLEILSCKPVRYY